jgi:hypothetical protein
MRLPLRRMMAEGVGSNGDRMRVLVCGGRDYANREAVFHELHELALKHGSLVVIQGAVWC